MRLLKILAASGVLALLTSGCVNPYTVGRDRPQPTPRAPFLSPSAIDALATGFVAQRFPGLDGNDRRRTAEAMVASLENGRDGQPNPWRNPDSGNSGEVVPGPVRAEGLSRCREIQVQVRQRGTPADARTTACRGADGVWNVRA